MPPKTPTRPPLNTFIIRFWREQGAEGVRWHGQIQHIQSGERIAFTDEEVMLSFIRRWVQTSKDGKW
ncbi:MAG: hypothetical protein DRI61_07175 [Chloroflexi bacterium]|nr:MAG: hypothetical protein DRI61_07175 [Chloroflexota bacterium]HDN78828.1 hypothetical protein [Chloroflexota bacterium]